MLSFNKSTQEIYVIELRVAISVGTTFMGFLFREVEEEESLLAVNKTVIKEAQRPVEKELPEEEAKLREQKCF